LSQNTLFTTLIFKKVVSFMMIPVDVDATVHKTR